METSLKTGFAQVFSCCPKNLSCPKFGGSAAPLAPPARTPMWLATLFIVISTVEISKIDKICIPARPCNILYLSSQNPGINFPYFQLARRSFRFPSQLISRCNFSQLAQILHEERVFCRAAPLGTPENNQRLHIVQKITKNLTTLHNLPNSIHKLQIKP